MFLVQKVYAVRKLEEIVNETPSGTIIDRTFIEKRFPKNYRGSINPTFYLNLLNNVKRVPHPLNSPIRFQKI